MKKKGVGAFVFHELTRVDAVMYVEHTHRYAVLQAGAAATWATTRQPTRGPWHWLYLTVDGYSNLASGREISHSYTRTKRNKNGQRTIT